MKRYVNALAALLQLARTNGRFTESKAYVLYRRPWVLLVIVFVMCMVGLAANILGYKWPSLVLAIAYTVAATYQWWELSQLGIVAGVGLVAGSATHTQHDESIEAALGLWKLAFLWVLLVPETFLLITGEFFIHKEDIVLILGTIVGITVFTILVTMWPKVFPGNMGKKSVYYYSIGVIVLSLGNLASGGLSAMVMTHTGWDPASIKPTDTEEALYRLNHVERKMADEDRATELERITDKVTRREALTQAEVQFVAEAQQSQSGKRAVPSLSANVPLASAPQSSWPTWVIPPEGRSARVTSPPGMHLVAAGNHFLLHAVYPDGHECQFGQVCENASEIVNYATNESGETNVVAYAFTQN